MTVEYGHASIVKILLETHSVRIDDEELVHLLYGLADCNNDRTLYRFIEKIQVVEIAKLLFDH